MNPFYIDKDEKLIKLVERKKDILLNNKKNYLHYILIFILLILIIYLVIFLIFILKGKELNDERKLNEFEPGYFLPDDDLKREKYKKPSFSNSEIFKGNKSNNYYYYGKKNYSIKSFALDDKCLKWRQSNK